MATPEYLCALLLAAIRAGARAAELMANSPELVAAICEYAGLESATPGQRAMFAEREIRAAIADLSDERLEKFVAVLLGLSPGTYKRRATIRHDLAGDVFKVSRRTAYDYKKNMLLQLAMRLIERAEERRIIIPSLSGVNC